MNKHTLYRPPAEAFSTIIQITHGCFWNQCTFCGMYKDVPARILSEAEIEKAIALAHRERPRTKRIFLADGDAMALPFKQLKTILETLNDRFPKLARVNVYATGRSIQQKSDAELRALKTLKLNTLYMGLESGHEPTLRQSKKRETADEMVQAGLRAQAAGLKMSVMILVGLAGTAHSQAHAEATAAALNVMQPRLLSALRVIPVPGTELCSAVSDGTFQPLSEAQASLELAQIIERLQLKSTVFRADHASNVIPLEGRFPKDQTALLQLLRSQS